MTKKANGLLTIEQMVANVLDQIQKPHMYNELAETVAQKIVRGYQDLNFYHHYHVEVAYLPVNEMNAVNLPDDYIDYHKIGILSNGQVWTLSINDNIALPRREVCGQTIRSVITSGNPEGVGMNYGYYFPDHYRNGRFVGGLYGLGGGFNTAYYRIDKGRNQIILSGSVPRCEIVLEYQSNGISTSRESLIPMVCREVLIAYAVWKMAEGDMDMPMNRIMLYKQNYYEEIEKFRFLETSITLDEFKDALYEGFYNGPKR